MLAKIGVSAVSSEPGTKAENRMELRIFSG